MADAPSTAPRLLLCDCAGTMAPDPQGIARGAGVACSRVHHELCRADRGRLAEALAEGPVLVACAQERAAFEAVAEAAGTDPAAVACVDLRDRAGWGEGDPGPKMAALVAAARIAPPEVPTMDVESRGLALVYGPAEVALAAGVRLAETLSVTVMLTEPEQVIPPAADVAVVTGRIAGVTGALGGFALDVDRFAELAPAGRGPLGFGSVRDGARTECDIVVDLSGERALVPAPHKRDGYLRADPADPVAVERALFEASHLTGTFEKTLHIRVTESLCAHSRAGKVGCTRCLDVCPTGAIVPDGEHIRIAADVCAGCGGCAAVCPSGAAASEEVPTGHLFATLRAMAQAFGEAGGTAPRLLVHDDHGAEMIRLGARFGRGLPADVVPLHLPALAAFGHAEQVGALGLGFACVDILAGPRAQVAEIAAQMAIAEAIAEGAGAPGRLRVIEEADPDAALETLYEGAPAPRAIEPILAAGGRRETVRLAARALAGGVPDAPLPLPGGAPYGAVVVDTTKCTLCMACSGLCPTGALGDNPDRPELSFREEACIQCGLCANLCPETAIRLEPRLDLSDAALAPRVLNEEEPFACISCGKPFGVKSTIEKITAKLSAHAMFQGSDNARLIQMCDDCRVRAQYHSEAAPFRMGERPRPRTTDDYLAGGGGSGEA